MKVDYQTNFDGSVWTAKAQIQYGRRHVNQAKEVWFRSSEQFSCTANFLVPLALMPSMDRGEDLILSGDASISPKLLASLDQIQTLYKAFGPEYGHRLNLVKVEASAAKEEPGDESRGVACFFSGGIDSFYSVLKHRDELDALIFIRGFDTRLDQAAVGELQITEIRRAAKELGIRLVEVTTNVRSDFSDSWLHWELYHGGVMAAIAHLLEPNFRRFYIASSYSYRTQDACGTHPLLDPLWSTESIEFIHDGGESTRWEKLTAISDNIVVQKYLKICWKYYDGHGNCGRCRQCLYAMAALRVLGRSHLFKTFPETIDLELLATTNVGLVDELRYAFTFWKFVKSDPELASALEASIHASIAKIQARMQQGRESAQSSDLTVASNPTSF